MTTTVFNIKKLLKLRKKIPDTCSLVTTTVLNIKIGDRANKIPDHAKCIITQEFNRSTRKNFASRIKQANLVNKTDFDNKYEIINSKITSNKTKFSQVLKTLDSLTAKLYNFFIGRMYFTSNDGIQNTFIYQPTLDTWK